MSQLLHKNRILLIIVLFALSACAEKAEKKDEGQISQPAIQKPSPSSPPSPKSASEEEEIVTTFFDKTYDNSLLDGLLQQPPHLFIDYIRKNNIDIFIIDHNLSSAPDFVQDVWREISLQRSFKGGSVKGMYIPLGYQIGKNHCDANIMILSNDYTPPVIAHEFLHYLFDRSEKKSITYALLDSSFERLLKQLIQDMQSAIDRYLKQKEGLFDDKEIFKKNKIGSLLSLIYELTTLTDQLYVYFRAFLEESMVCQILLNKFLVNKIALSEHEILNNFAYARKNIGESKQKFKAFADPMKQLIEALQKDIKHNEIEVSSANERLRDILKTLSDITSQTHVLEEEFEKIKRHPKILEITYE